MRSFFTTIYNAIFDFFFLKFDQPDLRLSSLEEKKIKNIPFPYLSFLYLEIYKKLYEILETVYTGYEGKNMHLYISPEIELDSKYTQLKNIWERLDTHLDQKLLPIDDFTWFPDLYGNHMDRKKTFRYFQRDVDSNIGKIYQSLRPKEYFVTYELEHIFNFIDELLADHRDLKQKTLNEKQLLEAGYLSYDPNTAQLRYRKESNVISSEITEIKFLLLLVEKADRLVEYPTITAYTGRDDTPESVHRLKTDLKRVLRVKGFSETTINEINKMITTVKGKGYILKSA